MDLTDKIAVVTGAGSGIGRATSVALAEAGAAVIVTDVDADGGRETTEMIGETAHFAPLDVTDRAACDALATDLQAEHGRVDIVVNAAGWDRIQPFVDSTADFVDMIVELNLKGPMNVCQAMIPALTASGSGRIVNVASDAGRVGSSGETVYAGAKGGTIAFTKSLAREMTRHQIRVNCVCPGPTDTPLFAALPDNLKQALERAIPMRRLARPSEIADAIVFFASDRSSFVTGQVLSVSGGLTMAD